MIGLQALFGMLAVYFASGRLQAREPNPNWVDPTRGHRPRCGDDPILWREYEMPIRKGSGPLILLRLRYVWILIRAILMSLLALLTVFLALAVPVGLLVSTIYYGLAAFRELSESGYGMTGPFEDRSYFNMLIRAATGMLAFLPALGSAALINARITLERSKKNWDAFLTTPLTGEEILKSKAKVALYSIWHTAKPLPVPLAVGPDLAAW